VAPPETLTRRFGIAVLQWLQQDGANDGEHGGVAADGERQRENSRRSEGGFLAHSAQGVEGIAPDGF
jgi:hypothetical protein